MPIDFRESVCAVWCVREGRLGWRDVGCDVPLTKVRQLWLEQSQIVCATMKPQSRQFQLHTTSSMVLTLSPSPIPQADSDRPVQVSASILRKAPLPVTEVAL